MEFYDQEKQLLHNISCIIHRKPDFVSAVAPFGVQAMFVHTPGLFQSINMQSP